MTTMHIGAPPRFKTADQLRAERRDRRARTTWPSTRAAGVVLFLLLLLLMFGPGRAVALL